MGLIFDTMRTFLEEDGWGITRIGDSLGFSMTVKGESEQWGCIALADEEARIFLFYSICPTDVPPATRAKMAEFITFANYNTLIGNFELNFDDGDLRYKTSLGIKEIPDAALQANGLLTSLIKQLVYSNVAMMNQYLPGIRAVLDDEASPKEAITRIEGS